MHLLPYQQLRLLSPLSPEEALRKLATEIKPPERRFVRFSFKTDGKFQGTVSRNRFEIHRDIGYRNDFLPMLQGTLNSAGDGCIIEVEMKMRRAATYFMTLWLSVIASLFLILHFAAAQGNLHDSLLAEAVPAALFILGIVIMMAGFYPEAATAKKFLCASLKAEETDSHDA